MARNAPAKPTFDDLDDFNLGDFDDGEDPFRTPSPGPANGNTQKQNDKKRKNDGLGIDEEVDVTKRARAPRVKLDETRLLSDAGIPKLRKRARDLKFKGKGHEFSDAARLLTFYQFWLDDLFPKAKFLDALAMVEKAGHKRVLASQRLKWIDEFKPKSSVVLDEEEEEEDIAAAAGTTASTRAGRPNGAANGDSTKTPAPTGDADDVPDDLEDLFGATPIRPKPAAAPQGPSTTNGATLGDDDDFPGEDDLDALMAEAGGQATGDKGRGQGQGQSGGPAEDGEDDLDALMAEAEANTQRPGGGAGGAASNGKAASGQRDQQDDFADEEAAMAEMGGLW